MVKTFKSAAKAKKQDFETKLHPDKDDKKTVVAKQTPFVKQNQNQRPKRTGKPTQKFEPEINTKIQIRQTRTPRHKINDEKSEKLQEKQKSQENLIREIKIKSRQKRNVKKNQQDLDKQDQKIKTTKTKHIKKPITNPQITIKTSRRSRKTPSNQSQKKILQQVKEKKTSIRSKGRNKRSSSKRQLKGNPITKRLPISKEQIKVGRQSNQSDKQSQKSDNQQIKQDQKVVSKKGLKNAKKQRKKEPQSLSKHHLISIKSKKESNDQGHQEKKEIKSSPKKIIEQKQENKISAKKIEISTQKGLKSHETPKKNLEIQEKLNKMDESYERLKSIYIKTQKDKQIREKDSKLQEKIPTQIIKAKSKGSRSRRVKKQSNKEQSQQEWGTKYVKGQDDLSQQFYKKIDNQKELWDKQKDIQHESQPKVQNDNNDEKLTQKKNKQQKDDQSNKKVQEKELLAKNIVKQKISESSQKVKSLKEKEDDAQKNLILVNSLVQEPKISTKGKRSTHSRSKKQNIPEKKQQKNKIQDNLKILNAQGAEQKQLKKNDDNENIITGAINIESRNIGDVKIPSEEPEEKVIKKRAKKRSTDQLLTCQNLGIGRSSRSRKPQKLELQIPKQIQEEGHVQFQKVSEKEGQKIKFLTQSKNQNENIKAQIQNQNNAQDEQTDKKIILEKETNKIQKIELAQASVSHLNTDKEFEDDFKNIEQKSQQLPQILSHQNVNQPEPEIQKTVVIEEQNISQKALSEKQNENQNIEEFERIEQEKPVEPQEPIIIDRNQLIEVNDIQQQKQERQIFDEAGNPNENETILQEKDQAKRQMQAVNQNNLTQPIIQEDQNQASENHENKVTFKQEKIQQTQKQVKESSLKSENQQVSSSNKQSSSSNDLIESHKITESAQQLQQNKLKQSKKGRPNKRTKKQITLSEQKISQKDIEQENQINKSEIESIKKSFEIDNPVLKISKQHAQQIKQKSLSGRKRRGSKKVLQSEKTQVQQPQQAEKKKRRGPKTKAQKQLEALKQQNLLAQKNIPSNQSPQNFVSQPVEMQIKPGEADIILEQPQRVKTPQRREQSEAIEADNQFLKKTQMKDDGENMIREEVHQNEEGDFI